MKHFLAIITLTFFLFVETNQVSALPYQILNSDFESWDYTISTSEPVNWTSFAGDKEIYIHKVNTHNETILTMKIVKY